MWPNTKVSDAAEPHSLLRLVRLEFLSHAKTWKLPADWTGVRTVQITNVSVDGAALVGTAEVKDGEVALTLAPGQAVVITAQ